MPRLTRTRKRSGPYVKPVHAARVNSYRASSGRMVAERPASKTLMIPANCSFPQAREISRQLNERERLYVAESDIPEAGLGVKASRPFQTGEAVLELKGHAVHSFPASSAPNSKLVSIKISGGKADILKDDRHVLFLDGVRTLGDRNIEISHGISPYNQARYLNSSCDSTPNLTLQPVINPAIVASAKKKDIILKPGRFTEQDVHVLGVATAPIKKNEELLFPYDFSADCSYLCETPETCQSQICSVLDVMAPQSQKYRKQCGWFYNDASYVTVQDLLQTSTCSDSPELTEKLTALAENPGKQKNQKSMGAFPDSEIALQALIVSHFHTSTSPYQRNRLYNICERLNRMKFKNHICPESPWGHADLFRYITLHKLIAPAQEMGVIPMSYIAEEVAANRTDALERFIRHEFDRGVDVSSIAGNLQNNNVPVIVQGHAHWCGPAIQSYCDKKGIEVPLFAKADKHISRHQEAEWNLIRQGNVHKIWTLLETYRAEKLPVGQIITELCIHKASLSGTPVSEEDFITLGHLVDFIQTHGDEEQKQNWLSFIRLEIINNNGCRNFGRRLAKGILATRNQWLLLASIEARLSSGTNTPTFMARNMREQKIPMLPSDSIQWSSTNIYIYLRERGRDDLAQRYLDNAGPQIRKDAENLYAIRLSLNKQLSHYSD